MNGTSRRPMRRILLAAVVLVALVGVFVVRLVDLQVVRAAELSEEAEGRRSTSVTVYGSRGDIVDRNGIVLAEAVMRYDIAVSPKNANAGPIVREQPDPDDPAKTVSVDVPLAQSVAELGAVLGLTAEQVQAIIADALAEDPDSDFAYVAKLVDTETYEKVTALDIPWVVPWEHPSRYYPNGAVGGNLLGFVDPDGNAVAGLEYSEDECLAGQDGRYTYLHSLEDWVQIPGTKVVQQQAHDGGTLKLTIDSDLQWMVQRSAEAQVQAVGADWATVTVMEAKTGRLLAVADVPTVDPNTPSSTDSSNRGSRAFTAPFEPGSTFKALTAASVIDAGKADPISQIIAPYRYLPPNGANVNDTEYHPDQRLTLTGVLIESSNTGISQFGERLSDPERYDDMLAFGLGERTEVGFPGEEPGDLHGGPEAWDNQTKYATMFGQGLTTTAVQIASIYQTIANGGIRMPVRLDRRMRRRRPALRRRAPEVISSVRGAADKRDARAHVPRRLARRGMGDPRLPRRDQDRHRSSRGRPRRLPTWLPRLSVRIRARRRPPVRRIRQHHEPGRDELIRAAAPVFRQVLSHVLTQHRTTPSGIPAPELPEHGDHQPGTRRASPGACPERPGYRFLSSACARPDAPSQPRTHQPPPLPCHLTSSAADRTRPRPVRPATAPTRT